MEFDYVIVGGGSAGSVLAARLSEDPSVTVCLLEAGGDGKNILIRAPLGLIATLPGRPKINNWAFETVPQPGLGGRRGYQPRGRALGGSSALNAMLYVRGHPSDYDDWAKAGCDGWGWTDVLPLFRRCERNVRGSDDFHGASGPLEVAEQRSPRPISRAFVDAAAEVQIRRNDDFNGPDQEGAGLYQVTQFWRDGKQGERCSAAAAYLHPVMNRHNLKVITRAHATRVVLEGLRARGVTYRKGRAEHHVTARAEVILCGGAFNSPQLLMLSGIGPADHLRARGVEVVRELPGVGQNLQDHLDYIYAAKTRDTDVLGLGPVGACKLIRDIMSWRRDGTGIVASPGAEAGAFLKSDPDLERPDLQLHFVAALVDDHSRKWHLGYGYSCHVCVLRPWSRGQVGLDSPDPMRAPRIDPKYLSDPRDADLMLKGARITREIMNAPALRSYRRKEVYTRDGMDDAELMSHIRARADTIYHPVGTCRMGRDAGAVTDPQLRVHGVQGLRVVDASVMPTLIGGNTNAPTMMIAEKAADMILAQARG
ncbi:GMC family oxidoreductase [Hoeflea ulvae]|uniref:GMC family oxidoreductase N-terminal domain-containing protein n=1 Tax=Hoeflea ulvae TaxID=2983764 RepID=A0ABT3YEK3_9HYPH|nr:GMC family oxidoreductase N-terminal domain-containing protein [Hoeflea ulvae]MCY0094242.1 GMC family oxidoreductase N-terminal domain-containing protein [Hoeflea ulvae]